MKRLLVASLLLVAGSWIAPTVFAAGDIQRGSVLYYNCVNCHGKNGEGKELSSAPAIAGQHSWYLLRQLQNFKSGVRGTHADDVTGQQMKAFSLTLATPAEMENVVAYIGTLKPQPLPATVPGDPVAGKTAYGTCMACHGAQGEGNQALNAPKLAGLPDWYIVTQLNSFQKGYRGVHKKDTYGQQMRPMSLALTPQSMNDIAAYVATMSGLTPPKPTAEELMAATPAPAAEAAAPAPMTALTTGQVTGQYVPYDNPLEADASFAVCASCHGNNAQGNERLNAPRLAGQHDWYLARQLQNWKDGIRGTHPTDLYGMQMRPLAMALTDAEVQSLATQAANYQAPYPRTTLAGDMNAGRAAYGVCASCHGPDGAGNQALNAPKLAGLPDWYVARQLSHFRDGARGRNPKDTYGQQMAPMAAGLSDQGIVDLATYIATLREGEIDTTPVVAAAPAATGTDTAAAATASASNGQALYGTCAGCHGPDGAGNQALNAPHLAGQAPWYIARQLANFKAGIRGGHADDMYGKQMAPMAMALSDADMQALGEYVSGLTGAPLPATLDGDAAAGQGAYATCAGCHGADGAGNQALNAPKLAGLPDWYIVRQLANFKGGIRGSHPDDMYGKQMAPMSMALDEAGMKNIAAYILTLQ